MFSLISNIGNIGDIAPEIPLPVPHNILTPTILSQLKPNNLSHTPQTPLVNLNQITQMLQDSNIDYVKLKPNSTQNSPSPILNGILSQKNLSSLHNVLAQPHSHPQISGLPTTRIDSKPPKSRIRRADKHAKSQSPVVVSEPISAHNKDGRSKPCKEVPDIDLEKCYGFVELSNFAELLEDLFSATDIEEVGKENVAFSSQYQGLMNEHGIVSAEFLLKLRTEIALVANSASSVLPKVPTFVLSRLVSVLEQQVLQGASASLTKSGSYTVYTKINTSLEAMLVVLSLMVIENMPKSIFSEEFIENMLSMVKFQLFSNVLAHHDPSFKVYAKSDGQKIDGDSDEEDVVDKKKTKKDSTRQNKALADEVKHITGYICEILDKLHALASKFVFTDAVIIQLTNITLPVFFVEGVNSLQLGALDVVRAVFARYPLHRALILDEVFGNLAKLPKTKRNLRMYRLPMENKSIQMVSALVLQLIQSCTALPSEERSDEDRGSSFDAALICAKTFLSSFMKRCANRVQEDDYRPILENFAADILTTLNMPEWPAAEILLQILNSNLVSNIAKKADPANVLRLLSIELLGTIGARLRIEVSSCDGSTPLPPAMSDTSANEEDARCICNKGDFGSFMLDCDDCHKWFHGACVGIDESNPPKIWYCDACQIKRQVGSHKKKAGDKHKQNDIKESPTTSNDVMKQIYLNYLTTRARSDASTAFARQFCLAQWCHYDQGEGEEVIEYYKSQWDLPPKTTNNVDVTITRDGVLKIGRSLAAQRGQHKAFNAVLNNLLSVLSEPQRSCRAKAMRALTAIVEADSSILGDMRVQNSVKTRFLDESPAVRESTVELVGRFVLSKPELLSTYYEKIVDRISDKAVSVRKRVVKLLRDISLQQPNNQYASSISKALVGRINDEDSIKELVIKIFHNTWFSGRLIDDNKSGRISSDISTRVSQIMEVVSLIDTDDWLVDLLEKILKDKDKKQIAVCGKLCDCLVETMLSAEDKRVKEPGATRSTVVSAVKGLHTFCKAHPPLLVSHVTTLATYLQVTDRSNKEESTIALYAAKILEKTVPYMDRPDPSFLSQVEADLVTLIQTQGTPVVQSCIQCLCEMVNKVTQKATKLEELMRKYYPLLETTKTQMPKTEVKSIHILRSILVSSMVCRYFDLDSKGIADVQSTDTKQGNKMLLSPGHVVDTIMGTFLHFTRHKDLEVQVRVLHGIGCLCLRKPQLLMASKVKSMVEASLLEQSPRLKEAILKVLAELLEGEDAKAKQSVSKDKDGFVSVDENPGFGLVGTTMQVHLDKILSLLLDKDERVRSAAIATTHRIVSHRLVIPIDCVPYLMALEGDHVQSIADAAHKLLVLINEKHPSFLLNRIVEGVKRLHSFRQSLFSGETDTRYSTSAVVKIYGIIKSTRSNRNNFLSSLVKALEYTKASETDASLSRFICEIAAFLPYTTPDEPVVIVQAIDKIVSLKASQTLADLKPASSSPPTVSASSSSSSHSSQFRNECSAANTIIFLLELKRFLISRYSLSSRYKNLAPNEAIKGPLTDKLAPEDSSLFPDAHPFSPILGLSAGKDLFCKLKTIMEEDEAEYFPLVVASPTKARRKGHAAVAAAAAASGGVAIATSSKKRKALAATTTSTASNAAKPKARPKRQPKKLKMDSVEDFEDNDNDDDGDRGGEGDEDEYHPDQ